MGSTVAVTDRFGERVAEVDYLDYGAPLYAPVVVDWTRIADIEEGGYLDVSNLTLKPSAGKLNEPTVNSLRGMELRVKKTTPSGADDVYLAATVISAREFGGTWTVEIRDPGHALFDAWDGNELDKHSGGVYDLSARFHFGVMDSFTTGSFTGNNWDIWVGGVPATFIHAETAPFLEWMKTRATMPPNPPSMEIEVPLYARIGPNAQGQYREVMVLGVQDQAPGPPQRSAALQGARARGQHPRRLPRRGQLVLR